MRKEEAQCEGDMRQFTSANYNQENAFRVKKF